jgi:hypothetical protein
MTKIGRLCLLLVPAVVLLAAIAPSAAANGTTIARQSVVGDTFTCDGDVFTVTAGAFKVVTKETLTPSGAYHLIVEGNAQGVKAVGPGGATYQAPGGFWMEVNVTPGATVMTQTGVLNVIGQGSAADFTLHTVVHTTVDAKGNVTAVVDHLGAGSCVVPPQP